jgi:hypothetical protein
VDGDHNAAPHHALRFKREERKAEVVNQKRGKTPGDQEGVLVGFLELISEAFDELGGAFSR